MSRLSRLVLCLGLAALVQGCQLSAPGSGSGTGDVTPNAVIGGEIEVTALDEAPAPAPVPTAAPPAAEPTAAPQGGVPQPDPAAAAEPAPAPAPQPEPVADPPETPKSEAQLACEKRKGKWVRAGTGSLRTCVFETRDGGKRCTRESQCEGVCLARSGTCSPLKPLLGCNEILQDNGARVTLCIE